MTNLTKEQWDVWNRLKHGVPKTVHTYTYGTHQPPTPVTGQMHIDSTTKLIYVYDGATWQVTK